MMSRRTPRALLALGWLTSCWLAMLGAEASAADRLLAAAPAGPCALRLEALASEEALRIRAHHPESRSCRIEAEAVIALLADAFSASNPATPLPLFRSLTFGRLIDYPWLSQFLAHRAAADRAWDLAKGRPVAGDVNRFVAQILSSREILDPLEPPLARHGYAIGRASVEKVLVGGFDQVPLLAGPPPRGRVPFDAILWLRLQRPVR
jgi:hypothetical protein